MGKSSRNVTRRKMHCHQGVPVGVELRVRSHQDVRVKGKGAGPQRHGSTVVTARPGSN
ncbi:hypothetical protein BJV78DRAFT_1246717, partial [Lactifluus subvellereus]